MSNSTRTRMTVGAIIAAAGLTLLPALSASAATASVSNATATLSATASALSAGTGFTTATGTGPFTVAVDGTGYEGTSATFVPVGVYAVYGPKEPGFNLNSGWFYDAQWINGGDIIAAGGDFSTSLDIVESYTANPYHADAPITVDCGYDDAISYEANLAAGQYKCYIQTFTAHGMPLNSADELALEVRW